MPQTIEQFLESEVCRDFIDYINQDEKPRPSEFAKKFTQAIQAYIAEYHSKEAYQDLGDENKQALEGVCEILEGHIALSSAIADKSNSKTAEHFRALRLLQPANSDLYHFITAIIEPGLQYLKNNTKALLKKESDVSKQLKKQAPKDANKNDYTFSNRLNEILSYYANTFADIAKILEATELTAGLSMRLKEANQIINDGSEDDIQAVVAQLKRFEKFLDKMPTGDYNIKRLSAILALHADDQLRANLGFIGEENRPALAFTFDLLIEEINALRQSIHALLNKAGEEVVSMDSPEAAEDNAQILRFSTITLADAAEALKQFGSQSIDDDLVAKNEDDMGQWLAKQSGSMQAIARAGQEAVQQRFEHLYKPSENAGNEDIQKAPDLFAEPPSPLISPARDEDELEAEPAHSGDEMPEAVDAGAEDNGPEEEAVDAGAEDKGPEEDIVDADAEDNGAEEEVPAEPTFREKLANFVADQDNDFFGHGSKAMTDAVKQFINENVVHLEDLCILHDAIGYDRDGNTFGDNNELSLLRRENGKLRTKMFAPTTRATTVADAMKTKAKEFLANYLAEDGKHYNMDQETYDMFSTIFSIKDRGQWRTPTSQREFAKMVIVEDAAAAMVPNQ